MRVRIPVLVVLGLLTALALVHSSRSRDASASPQVVAGIAMSPTATSTAPVASVDLAVGASAVGASDLTAIWSVTVLNRSRFDAAPNTVLTLVLPPGTSGLVLSPSLTCTGSGPYACPVGTLAANSSATYQVQSLASGPGAYVLNAAVASGASDPDTTNNAATSDAVIVPGPTCSGRACAATATPTATPTPPNQTPPNRFFGSVTVNGQPAGNGTLVTALIGSTVCGTATVASGAYLVDVVAATTQFGCGTPGAPVTFQVGAVLASQTGTWQSGAVTLLNLTVCTLRGGCTAPSGTPTPPNRFQGIATVNGQPAPDGTQVLAFVNGVLCGSTATTSGIGQYTVDVASSATVGGCANDGDQVFFQVDGAITTQIGIFQTGAITNLNLTACTRC
ncbi:MAG TPA: hypothetical protein VFD32_10040 [Dehalococcoidia bacterium]|nr:hypothetical protein [Dehalococcoidia bacterium]